MTQLGKVVITIIILLLIRTTDNGLYLLYVVPWHITLSPGKATFLHDGFSLLYRGS